MARVPLFTLYSTTVQYCCSMRFVALISHRVPRICNNPRIVVNVPKCNEIIRRPVALPYGPKNMSSGGTRPTWSPVRLISGSRLPCVDEYQAQWPINDGAHGASACARAHRFIGAPKMVKIRKLF